MVQKRGAIYFWKHQYCYHENVVAGFYGKACTMRCNECERTIVMLYNFKTGEFDCRYGNHIDNQNKTDTISLSDGITLLNNYVTEAKIPKGCADMSETNDYYEEDLERFDNTMSILLENGLFADRGGYEHFRTV